VAFVAWPVWNSIPEAPVSRAMAALASGAQRRYLTKKAYRIGEHDA
jgi:hypothetical protein